MGKPLCIYHSNCADGFGAAWVVNRFFNGDVDLHAGVYKKAPPDVTGRDVILVDFSYPHDVIVDMLRPDNPGRARTVLVLDHHETAIDRLMPLGIQPPERGSYDPDSWALKWDAWGNLPIRGVLDMKRSGAMLAWNFFFAYLNPPHLIEHLQDRDLWKFNIPFTREIQATVFSYPYDLGVWDDLAARAETAVGRSGLIADGAAIERKHHKDVAELVGVARRRMRIGGHDVPVANLPYTLSSDAGHLLAHGEPFAACYMDTPDGRVFSLRSTNEGVNVAKVAAQYGGGGHEHASGFTAPLGWEGEG